MKLRVMGVSSGLGVSLHPFKKWLAINIECRGIFHTKDNEQWEMNFPGVPLIKSFPKKLLNKHKKRSKIKPVDVMISSPDCGSGSILRFSRAKKLGDHKQNKSLLLFFQAIKYYKPKFFLFENLEGLFKSFPKTDFENGVEQYHLIYHLGSVIKYGNSQRNRKRLVIVGIRKDIYMPQMNKYFLEPSIGNEKTCGDLYSDLDGEDYKIGHVREFRDEVISIYGGKRMSLLQIQKEWHSRLHNKTRYWVPEEEGRKFKTAPGVYKNGFYDYPNTARKANRQFDHNGLTLTPRQLARVQGVPDNFGIYIDPNKLKYWINKGRILVTKTPPYEISVWFKQQLIKSKHLWHH